MKSSKLNIIPYAVQKVPSSCSKHSLRSPVDNSGFAEVKSDWQLTTTILGTTATTWMTLSKKIDPMQKWLPLNYSFVRIQNSLTNLVRDNKVFTIFVSKTRLVRLF